MAGGQAIDLAAVGRTLERAGARVDAPIKTGALIRAAVRLGAVAARSRRRAGAGVDAYATAVGLAFQVVDDVLDVDGPTATLGKTAGKDAAQGKPTYVALLGIAGAKERAEASARRSACGARAVR